MVLSCEHWGDHHVQSHVEMVFRISPKSLQGRSGPELRMQCLSHSCPRVGLSEVLLRACQAPTGQNKQAVSRVARHSWGPCALRYNVWAMSAGAGGHGRSVVLLRPPPPPNSAVTVWTRWGRSVRCAKSRLFSTPGSHGSQDPEFCTPDAVFN